MYTSEMGSQIQASQRRQRLRMSEQPGSRSVVKNRRDSAFSVDHEREFTICMVDSRRMIVGRPDREDPCAEMIMVSRIRQNTNLIPPEATITNDPNVHRPCSISTKFEMWCASAYRSLPCDEVDIGAICEKRWNLVTGKIR